MPEAIKNSIADDGTIDAFEDGTPTEFRRFLPDTVNSAFFNRMSFTSKVSFTSKIVQVAELCLLKHDDQILEIEFENLIIEDKSSACSARNVPQYEAIDPNTKSMWLAVQYNMPPATLDLVFENLPHIIDHQFADATTVSYYDGSSAMMEGFSEVWDLWSENLSIITISDDEVSVIYLTFLLCFQ